MKVKLTTRIDNDLKESLEQLSKLSGNSMELLIETALLNLINSVVEENQ